jgi:hypothetical protein
MPRTRLLQRVLCGCSLALLASLTETVSAQPAVPPATDSWVQSYYAKDYKQALVLLQAEIAQSPRSRPTAHDHYNLACILARLSETDKSKIVDAEKSLLAALTAGFSDFHRLKADPSLTALKDSEAFAAITDGWRELQDAIAEDRIKSWAAMLTSSNKVATLDDARKALSLKNYRMTQFADLRVTLISAFSDKATLEVEATLRSMLTLWQTSLALPGDGLDTPQITRPNPWVTIVLLSADDFENWQRVQQQGRTGNIGGTYSSRRHELVSRDLGATLRHEFWHALHHRHMSQLNQDHPVWIQEGLCSLPEALENKPATRTDTPLQTSTPLTTPATTTPTSAPRGITRFAPNFRTSMAKRMATNRSLLPLDRFLSIDDNRFTSSQVLGNYAYARAVFHWLSEQGLLDDWYTTYTATYTSDRTGKTALQTVLKMDLPSADKAFRAWLATQQDAGDAPISGRPRAWLPVELTDAAGEGILVAPWPEDTDLRAQMRIPLAPGDVIVAIQGTRVHDIGELSQALAAFNPGDEIQVTTRQGPKGRERTVTTKLIEAE